MSPSAPFIQRPVATSLLMLAIVLAGIVGFKFLPLSALPQVDFPTIQVQTLYPGGSPEVMGQTVTAPLERQFGQMAGLQRMSSTSAAGVSIITLQFGLGQTLDVAEQEVQAAINAGSSLLPTDLPAPPVYAKVNPADAPVLTLAITSDTMPLTEVQNVVNTRLALKISQVSGVGLVTLSGGQRPAVRIQADTNALASYGLGLDTLRTAITAANANGAKGSFDGPTRAYSINANDQLVTAKDYKELILAYKNGAPVRLTDVATRGRQRRKRRAGRLVRHQAGDHPQRAAPAGRQRHRHRGRDQGPPAGAASRPAGRDACGSAERPHHRHPRLGRTRGNGTAAGRGAGGAGDLRLPAQHPRHRDRQPVGADLADRYLRRHVFAGLQPEQPVADGADHRHRLRGRRCDRDDREHRALHRGRRNADGGRAERRQADRLHHHLADGVADRRADSAAVHGRRGRPPVPRIRHLAGDHDPDFRRGVADAGADDVGALAEEPWRRKAEPLRAALPAVLRLGDRSLRPLADLGAGA
jgi:hypothetical protein